MAQVDIGIITIREDEFQAVLDVFPDELGDGVHRGKFREYALRKASAGRTGQYSLAILRLPEQGNGEALDAARDILEDLEPSLLLVVGIAGGLPSDDLNLGDVVLSTRINDYSVEARKEGAEPQYALSGGPIARKIQGGIANLAARRKDLGHKGDLLRMFKAAAKPLRIDEERADLDDNFKQVIRGLVQIVNGLAPIRNKMSDGHARQRKPAPHHARVIVNAAKTVSTFLIQSYLFQLDKGLLAAPGQQP